MPEATPTATPAPTAAAADPTTQMLRVHIRGSIQDVWHEMTRTDQPIPAFFNSRMDVGTLAPGSKMAMRTPDGKYTGVVGEILEFDPPHRFVHTFKFTNYDDPPCVVAFDLAEVDGGTQLTMTMSDLPVGTKTAKQMVQGGKLIVNTFKRVVETGRPSFGVRMLFVLFRLTAPLSPKKSRSEHWSV
jgi:uncharacterized protein YndB with AHSA1/START domain